MLFVLKTTYPIMRTCADICQEDWRVLDRLAAICQPTFPGRWPLLMIIPFKMFVIFKLNLVIFK
jgi:hypothetical protein